MLTKKNVPLYQIVTDIISLTYKNIMARAIKDTPVLTDEKDIKRVLDSIKKPKKVSKKELEEREKNYNWIESIKTFN